MQINPAYLPGGANVNPSCYLYARLVEFGDAGELLADVDVRVVALGERRLELLQLLLRERRPVSAARRRLARRRRRAQPVHVTGSDGRHDAAAAGRGAMQQAADTAALRLNLLERTFHTCTHAQQHTTGMCFNCCYCSLSDPGSAVGQLCACGCIQTIKFLHSTSTELKCSS